MSIALSRGQAFGGGPRQCIGNTFATAEAALILAGSRRAFALCCCPASTRPRQPRSRGDRNRASACASTGDDGAPRAKEEGMVDIREDADLMEAAKAMRP